MKAIGYCRVSTTEQGESRAGLEAQEAVIRSEVKHRGWELVTIRTDVASGKSMRRRPELAEALKALRAHEADALIVAKLDRLSRSVLDFATLMERAKSEGWSVVVIDLNIDMTTAHGELIAGFMIALAQWERRIIGDRTRSGLAAVRARGTKLGRPSNVDAGTLATIRALRGSGLSWQKIADALTRENVPTSQGGQWRASTVRKLVG